MIPRQTPEQVKQTPFIMNVSEHLLSFAPRSLLTLPKSRAKNVLEWWPSYEAFRNDTTVLHMWNTNRIRIYWLDKEIKSHVN